MRDAVPGCENGPETAPGPAAIINYVEGLVGSAFSQDGPFLMVGYEFHGAEILGRVPGVNIRGEGEWEAELALDRGVDGHAEGYAHGGLFDSANDEAWAGDGPSGVVVGTPFCKDVFLREVEVVVVYAGRVFLYYQQLNSFQTKLVIRK